MEEPEFPVPARRLALRSTIGAVARCRDFTRQALSEWYGTPKGVDAEAGSGSGADTEAGADDVLLLVSEVVANACLHGGGPRSLLLRRTRDRLRIEVTDNSPVRPAMRVRAEPSRPGGHGLRIVDRLARDWGWTPVEGGKCVWLEVSSPPRPWGAAERYTSQREPAPPPGAADLDEALPERFRAESVMAAGRPHGRVRRGPEHPASRRCGRTIRPR
ncbi:ATP-binding protein [Streptomyces sp. NPDC060028]|uniref:ATP-binding protein n=1 Tax=Streptomyces sp. NPDC060028 TaxID=3347041 RepID=UPI0036B37EB0